MKRLVTLLVLVLGLVGNMNAQVDKTLVKSIAVNSTTAKTTAATIVLPGDVAVTEWDKDFVRITTHLRVENMGESIVKQLVVVGRYSIDSKIDEDKGSLNITMPKMAHQITVKGVDLVEVLSFEVSVPKGYQFVIKGEHKVSNDKHIDLGQNL